jgi:hypothetical protein
MPAEVVTGIQCCFDASIALSFRSATRRERQAKQTKNCPFVQIAIKQCKLHYSAIFQFLLEKQAKIQAKVA